MRHAVLALALVLTAETPAVVVNDRPLAATVVELGGTLLAPMRAVFQALQCTVEDVDGRIIVRRAKHTVVLRLGSTTASVDGRSVTMPAAPRDIDGVAYVPLRFLSSALGAHTRYDARAELLTIDDGTAPFTSQQVGRAGSVQLLPAPNTRAATAYPSIGAEVSGASSLSGVTISVDGVDVSSSASVSGGSVLYIPQQGLRIGTHVVSIRGWTGSIPFAQTWTFDTTLPPAPDAAYNGGPYSYVTGAGREPIRLSVDGTSVGPGSWLNVQLTGPPNGQAFAYSCAGAWSYPLYGSPGSPFYSASIQIPYDIDVQRCPIVAEFVDQYGNIVYAPYPVFISIYNPLPVRVPVPAATPSPNPLRYHLPPYLRASPLPAASAVPLQRPQTHPIVLPTARALPTLPPRPVTAPSARPILVRTPLPRASSAPATH